MGPKPKPLQEPCPETTANGVSKKHWGFGGQPLYQHDVDALTKKGVDWEKDIMPDGRLKHPRYRLRRIANRTFANEAAKEYTSEETADLKNRYDALPEPRPPFFQWAAQQEVYLHYLNVKRISMHAKRDSDRIKAYSLLLEHGLAKPKQIVEQQVAHTEEEVPLSKLLDTVLEASGIDPLMFRQFMASQEKPAS